MAPHVVLPCVCVPVPPQTLTRSLTWTIPDKTRGKTVSVPRKTVFDGAVTGWIAVPIKRLRSPYVTLLRRDNRQHHIFHYVPTPSRWWSYQRWCWPPFAFGFKCRSLPPLLSAHRHRLLTCRRVTQIPLHLRESHLGEVQRCSVPLQERTYLREARAKRRAGASRHRRSSHLSRRRERNVRGGFTTRMRLCANEMNGANEGSTGVK